jgi:hypothetical protein
VHKLFRIEIAKFTGDSFLFLHGGCDCVANPFSFFILQLVEVQIRLPLVKLAPSFSAVFCLLLLLLKRGLLFVLVYLENSVLSIDHTHPFHPDFFE